MSEIILVKLQSAIPSKLKFSCFTYMKNDEKLDACLATIVINTYVIWLLTIKLYVIVT